jgi:diguanylate cyclase (GGDEF)-like protein
MEEQQRPGPKSRQALPPDLRILFVDDSDLDIELARDQLTRDGLAYEWRAAHDEAGLRTHLGEFKPHVILCDYSIPGFSGRGALQIVRTQSPATPFIFLSGTIGEERAVECLREGAIDYVLKDHPHRLGPAVRRALAEVEEHNAYEARIRHLANFDALTDLPNRALLHERLEQAIIHASRTARAIAVIVLNVDGFRRVNEAFGSAAADTLLRTVATRLTPLLREGDTLARSSGDEFIALMSDLAQPGGATPLLLQLLDAVKEPLTIGMRAVSVTASAGVAFFPTDGHTAEALLQSATSAMHRAKVEQRGAFLFSGSPDAMRQSLQRVMIESALSQALKRKEIRLVYQLQYDVATGRPCGMEALMRWGVGDRALPPATFIPVAEDSGQIRELGLWVLREACTQAIAWIGSGQSPLVLGVNVSPVQLNEKAFIANLRSILRATGFPPERLEVELTESALMRTTHDVLAAIEGLRELGVEIAIDDFGTGYSSLAYLSRLPIGRLKIDAGFVHRMAQDARDAKIAQSIVTLGHGLGLKVIAEGVETAEQLEMLRHMECDQAQGFFLCRPVAPERIGELIRG